MMKTTQTIAALLLVTSLASFAYGESSRDRRHKQIRKRLEQTSHLKYNYFAPSVHIRYHHPDPKATYLAYYNEIRVEKTVKHTYFCTIGFDVGYFGIQDHGSGHITIFSVWDKGGGKNDSSIVSIADPARSQMMSSKTDTQALEITPSSARVVLRLLITTPNQERSPFRSLQASLPFVHCLMLFKQGSNRQRTENLDRTL